MLSRFRTIVPYLIRYRWKYAAGLLSLFVRVAITAAIPLIVKVVIDQLSSGFEFSDLYILVAGMMGLALVKAGFQYAMRWNLGMASRLIDFDLQRDFFDKLLSLPERFYYTYRAGDILSRTMNDMRAVSAMTHSGALAIFEMGMTFVVTLAVMSVVDWRLTCLIFIPVPLMSLTVAHFSRKTHTQFVRVQQAFADLSSMAQENLSNMRVVRAYAQNELEVERFDAVNQRYLDQSYRLIGIWTRFYPQMDALSGLTFAVVLGYGGLRVVEGQMSLGSFVMFLSYLTMISGSMAALGWVVNLMERGAAAIGRLSEVLQYPARIEDGPDTDHGIEEIRGDLAIEDVTFSYPGSNRPALSDIDLEAFAGDTVAIVGSVGAGKSTLLDLPPRMIEPTLGRVKVDGVDIRRIPVRTLRRSIGFVPQESLLFSTTIRENLLLGLSDVEEWEIEEACGIAQVWDDIQSFPEGLDTQVGERGITLSGGQKQRIALARALLRNPRILILDDAVASVDAITEAKIFDRLGAFLRNRTTLIVSHRLSAARIADRVMVLEGGCIVESGTHEELLSRGGRYAELHRKQQLEEALVEDG